jgi:hypothetical protein
MASIKQSLAWWCFGRHTTPEELIAKAKQIGYHGVEMAPRQLYDKIRDGGLKVITTGGHGTLSDGLNKRENHEWRATSSERSAPRGYPTSSTSATSTRRRYGLQRARPGAGGLLRADHADHRRHRLQRLRGAGIQSEEQR